MCAHCTESGRRTMSWIQAILCHRERRRLLFVVISIVAISVAGRDSTLEFGFWYCSTLHDFLSNKAGICLHPSSLLDIFAHDNSGIENEKESLIARLNEGSTVCLRGGLAVVPPVRLAPLLCKHHLLVVPCIFMIFSAFGGVPSGPACSPIGILPLRAGSSIWLVDLDRG